MIVLPFPPSTLSGHNNGNRWVKAKLIKEHRALAKQVTKATGIKVPGAGDIAVAMHFYPPDNRSGDRVNFANRMKPYLDGIADALGVNDVRFLPSYHYHAPEKPGRVEVVI